MKKWSAFFSFVFLSGCVHHLSSPSVENQWVYKCVASEPLLPDWVVIPRWKYVGDIKERQIPQNALVCVGWSRLNEECTAVVQADLKSSVVCNKNIDGQIAFTRQ